MGHFCALCMLYGKFMQFWRDVLLRVTTIWEGPQRRPSFFSLAIQRVATQGPLHSKRTSHGMKLARRSSSASTAKKRPKS